MGLIYSPGVVTSGLVLYLDVGNTKSYPGSGTLWKDLSGYGNNFTLYGNPVFNSSNSGSLVFDGATQYALNSSPTSEILFTSAFTVFLFFEVHSSLTGSTDVRQSLWSGNTSESFGLELGNFTSGCIGNGLGTIGYRFMMHRQGNCFSNFSNTNQFIQNQICQFSFTRSSLKNGLMYVNGASISSLNDETSFTYATPSSIYIARRGTTSSQYFNGHIYCVLAYSRSLASVEIDQNYKALKGRFGL